MKVGSLFAGVGGFDIAAERAGMEVTWQSEVDSAACQVLEHHWPSLNQGDIHTLTFDINNIGGTHVSAVDVLCGGFPCQDYSVAGNRGGLAGDRGALWWEFHRLIAEGRPTWVVGENVPGLLSSRDGADFATIVDSLTELGYGVCWAVLDAQYFGVAQRRRRVFIVGHSGGQPRPEILALSEGMFGHPAPSRETGQGAAGTLEARTDGGGFPGTDFALAGGVVPFTKQRLGHYIDVDVASTVAQRDYKDATDLIAFAQNTRDEVRVQGDGSIAGALAAQPGMKQTTYLASFAWQAGGGKDASGAVNEDGSTPTLPVSQTLAVAYDELNDTLADTHHTLRAGTKQSTGVVSKAAVRRLTPLECERLQGFPDGWTDVPGNSDTQRYRQMGNAVAVPVVEWIMRRIAADV